MNIEERRLMTKVVKLYYLEGWTQTEIAKKINKSRPIVSKLLKQAKEKQIVEIYLKDSTVHTVQLERELEQKYNLKEAIVIESAHSGPELIMRKLGVVTARYIEKKLDQINTIGISWGTSVYAVVEAFQYQANKPVHLIPLIGGIGQNYIGYHTNSLLFELAQKLNSTSSYLYAPAVVESEELRNHIVRSKDVKEVLTKGKQVDIAIVGIGNPGIQNTMTEMGYLLEEDQQSLLNAGAIGDINSNFFNKDGELVDHPLNNRTVGVKLEDIKNISEVITIVRGDYKLFPLHVALENNFITTLVIDSDTAEKLLKKYK
ncbi:DeoR family transcriptional regulator [Oceanobacillus oncorhynchi subsp. incaldanensis]|uniref:Deoxyribonucleoside regulator n=2 Tax=Oceanobacillus TaxID=182709 RepID=A0A0A1MX66_9BACI|nr:sugar-binding transcriptional regulator [Oceanobacillus oncorhynchi]MDM8099670.1 sugar-binding transcriptional regulator [Oceanobacillus oncorhynchi]UUI41877.1 sugar-binding transcriptional regulator [Oceanobacillus oncorhynchi]GIO19929.1 DeoR family transcriptional regulator [Oceanobacillus oncorhynchi subsp. incaldanensis]CEI83381.1 Deoxyribonucleoside regulator [Oceanobacillus oncorhynchi]